MHRKKERVTYSTITLSLSFGRKNLVQFKDEYFSLLYSAIISLIAIEITLLCDRNNRIIFQIQEEGKIIETEEKRAILWLVKKIL